MKPGKRPITGKHLLEGDAGVARAEEMDHPIRGDRLGTPTGNRVDPFELGRLDVVEEPAGPLNPVRGDGGSRGVSHGDF